MLSRSAQIALYCILLFCEVLAEMEGGHWGRGKGQTADCKETQEVPRHPLFLKHIILNNKNLDKIFSIFNSDRVETQKTEGDTS